MAVTLYRQVGKGKSRRYQKVNLDKGRRPADLAGPYFLRYSLADGTRPWEHVGDDLDEAIAARERKQAYFEALDTCRSFKTKMTPVGLELRMLSINGSQSFNCSKPKTNKARARRRCQRTTTASASFSTSQPRTTCATWITSIASSFCGM
jgi:hypothetical protein